MTDVHVRVIYMTDVHVMSPGRGLVMAMSPWKISNTPLLSVFCPEEEAGYAGYTHRAVPVGPLLWWGVG